MLPNPVILTNIIKRFYPYFLDQVFPYDYLTAKSFDGSQGVTVNTIAIHHYDGSWLDSEERFKKSVKTFLWSKWWFRSVYKVYNSVKLFFKSL